MNKTVKIILIFLVLLLAVSTVVSLVMRKRNEKFQNTCGFIPGGITLQECLDACNMKRNMGDEGCDTETCESKCDNCSSTACEWKQDRSNSTVNVKTPLAAKIKGYSGDRQIKITWVEPLSRLPLTKYILVCETDEHGTKLFYPSVTSKLPEYSLFNLENDKEYKIRLYSENDDGMSIESNVITVKPEPNKETPIFSTDIQDLAGIDNSNESNKRNIIRSVEEKYKEKIGYDDTKKDYYELLKLLNDTKPKIDLQDENIKIKFV